jgi:hypothetical protein
MLQVEMKQFGAYPAVIALSFASVAMLLAFPDPNATAIQTTITPQTHKRQAPTRPATSATASQVLAAN